MKGTQNDTNEKRLCYKSINSGSFSKWRLKNQKVISILGFGFDQEFDIPKRERRIV